MTVGRERLRQILETHQVTLQRTKTWKESNDPDCDATLDRIEDITNTAPDRCFAFDEFGPLSIRAVGGQSWSMALLRGLLQVWLTSHVWGSPRSKDGSHAQEVPARVQA